MSPFSTNIDSDTRPRAPTSPTRLLSIEKGTRLTDYGTFDLTVKGLALGGMGLVVWGPNAGVGGTLQAARLVSPDRLGGMSRADQRQLAAGFEREALVWCRLWTHPYIIKATGLTRLPGWNRLPVLMLEYAQHDSLRFWLQQAHQSGTHLGLRAAFAWAQQIATALVAIHTPDPDHGRPDPLVHCDLKPEHVLIDGSNTARLTDLGLTRAVVADSITSATVAVTPSLPAPRDSGPHLSHEQREAQMRALLQAAGALSPTVLAPHPTAEQDAAQVAQVAQVAQDVTRSVHIASHPHLPAVGSQGPVAGTPPYMAPEQWVGLNMVVPATDIYALGVLLFELFAGVPGFPHVPDPADAVRGGDPRLAWYRAHQRGPARRLSDTDVQALAAGPLNALVEDQAGYERAARVRAGLDALIGQCLAPKPERRPSAETVRAQLAQLAEQAGMTPEPWLVPEVAPHTPANEANFWSNLAVTYGKIGQPEMQLLLLRRAVRLDGANPSNWANLGMALGILKRYEEALAALAVAEAETEALLTPEHPARHDLLMYTLRNNQGAALGELGRYAEEVAAYEQALALRSDKADTWFNLALAFAQWAQVPGTTPEQRLERLEAGEWTVRRAQALAHQIPRAKQLQEVIQRDLAQARREMARSGRESQRPQNES